MRRDFADRSRQFRSPQPYPARPETVRYAPAEARRTGSGSVVLDLAAEVIARSGRERPADATLREALRGARGLSRGDARAISQAVFAYYRWLGWLEGRNPLRAQIQRALDLADEFARQPQAFPDEQLVERAVPGWVREEMAVYPNWARAIQAEPRLWLRARAGCGSALAGKLGPAKVWPLAGPASELSDAVLYEGEADLFHTPEFQAGEFEIQDIHSQAVGLLCDPKPGETWWDACAGEGGKTLHLSDLMRNQGLIWASDRSTRRLQILKRRAARAKCFNYRAVFWEGGAKLPTKTKFDGILVDAPCSGLGTWQRNPHARWTTTRADVHELAEVQKTLLGRLAPAVKPGGKLIYAVCTLTRAETTGVVGWFNRTVTGFEPLELPPLQTEDRDGATVPGTRRLSPETGGNGMFIAAWRRGAVASP